MVKKAANKLKIDFQSCIIEDRLLQIKNHDFQNELTLIDTWSITIPTLSSKKVIGLMREYSYKDYVSLTHIKRIQKKNDTQLNVILCTKQFLERDQISDHLEKNEVPYEDLRIQQIPGGYASTKELATQWSETIWPLLWKGNPNDQVLNDTVIELNNIKSHLQLISDSSNKIEAELGIFTVIVDPINNQVISSSADERHNHPLDHSIMKCIQNVATFEQERRKTCTKEDQHYLCDNYHVYTTHEPCTMCSMALIHSRVSRLIYLKQMSGTGALNPKSGEGYVIQNHKLLNSSFEVWEWIGDEYKVREIDVSLNA